MMSCRGLGWVSALCAAAAAPACGVPDVSFVPMDASVADVSEARDSATRADAVADASDARDAGDAGDEAGKKPKKEAGAGEDDAAAGDSSLGADDAGCPTSPPPGYAMCCGAVACGGMCKASDCDKCSACAATDVCCIHGNAATCLDGGPCP